jgi:putative ABC transport system ATP-binding protein
MRPLSAASPIVTSDLVVDYHGETGTVRALACAPLHVAGGTGVAIMGPSGSGKSTLLGLLAGLALPTEGSVTIGGEVISTLTERDRVRFRRRALGMVYQADNLLPHLTVEENVALQVAICRDTSTNQPSDPGPLLKRLGLANLARRLPHQLSGGERQRVAVARAVVHGPQVILADEPTGALDAASGRIVIELLLEVHQEIGATLVVVTHDPQIAAHLARTVHLERHASPAGASDAR